MPLRNYKFSSDIHSDFVTSLKQRVHRHFSENQIGKNANTEMIMKTVSALSLYLVPYLFMIIARPSNVPLLIFCWVLMGCGIAFIGTSVMHDSLHGSYSKKKHVNTILGFSTWILGVDATIWKLQHNVLHHTYTNIEEADDDIDPRYVMRFSPNQPLRWFHRYQHIYAMFFYANATTMWITVKDYAKAFNYHKRGLLKIDTSFPIYILKMFIRKMSYFFIFLVIPIYVLPISAGLVITLFILQHLAAGTMLSMIFQPAHVIETSDFFLQEDEVIDENWYVHQLKTTTNFGMNSRLLFWFSGGLNHQVEHHLFPNICHVHYRKIAKIVKATAAEYDLPYHHQKTIGRAVYNHFKMLRELGKGQA